MGDHVQKFQQMDALAREALPLSRSTLLVNLRLFTAQAMDRRCAPGIRRRGSCLFRSQPQQDNEAVCPFHKTPDRPANAGRSGVLGEIGVFLQSDQGIQDRLEVGDDVLRILQAHADAHQALRDAGGLQLLRRIGGVGHGGGMLHQSLGVAQGDGDGA